VAEKLELVDAEKFFSTGGLFIDSGEPEDPLLDRPHILPLLKRLRDKHGLNWQAVVHKKKTKFAVALVAALPSESDVEKIKQTIDEAQNTFPGEILSQYGRQWMSIDFLTESRRRELTPLAGKPTGKRNRSCGRDWRRGTKSGFKRPRHHAGTAAGRRPTLRRSAVPR
jgi:hypothetical protein